MRPSESMGADPIFFRRTVSLAYSADSSHMYVIRLRHNNSTHRLPQGISFDTNASILPYKIMYLLTGGLAFVVGILVIIWMPDSPLHAVFLSQKERVIAVERIRDDQGGTENKTIKKYQVIEALTDIRAWLIVLLTVMSKFRSRTSRPHSDCALAAIPNGSLSSCK